MKTGLTAAAGAFALSLGGLAAAAQSSPAAVPDGHADFEQTCAACHQADGKGVEGAFPALAGNAFLQGAPEPVIATVLNGRNGMPSFRDQFTDQQIAAILTYARGAWGNHAAPIAAEQVTQGRAAPKS